MAPPTSTDLNNATREELIAIIQHQSQLIEQLRKQVEELLRKSHRPANPFSKNQPKGNPQPPGRKAGQGLFHHRPAPPEQPSDHHVQATTPQQCPRCGVAVEFVRMDTATIMDLPDIPQPRVTRYAVPVCRCLECGKTVRGTAPGLQAAQAGATAHRIGPRAMAMAQLLHYGIGIPVRKVPAVLGALTGLPVTASALTQDAMRQSAGMVGMAYEQLRQRMRESAVVHTDDTGWRTGGRNTFLMGFDSARTAVFQIRPQHRNQEVQEIIPVDFAGVLVTDRGVSYDARAFAAMRQQKCLAHLLKNISMVLEGKTGAARGFGTHLQALFREGMRLAQLPLTEERIGKSQELERRLTGHLRDRRLKDRDNQRLLDGIGAQMDRGRLLTFLQATDVEPTNNRAERMLRPAVIARKVSHCSKNERGAYATAAYLSLIQTARKGVAGQTAGWQAAVADVLISPEKLLNR